MYAILLAISEVAAVGSMDVQQVDKELSAIVYSSRGGWLFHRMSHLLCKNAARENRAAEVSLEYQRLEHEYVILGGVFAPGDEQEIHLESYHTSCEKGRAAVIAERWRVASEGAEAELRQMKALLVRKRELTVGIVPR